MTTETTWAVPVPRFTVHDRLKKAREAAGLDQRELAERMGVSRGTISNYEADSGKSLRKIVINAWALATGVPVEWIESGDDGGPRPDHDPDGGLCPRCAHRDSNPGPSD
ncbi:MULTISPECIES: helix-turn-helix domain-containing protein [Rhodococcoides]|uniref:helix-turn-helix domain-containing protein n=1 Tax=Rhodococcoides TaxID=3259750 RepID=UPI0009437EE6|nr:helix-turn-helix transcriptional regulator [Rhodococcus kroppenstedtii]